MREQTIIFKGAIATTTIIITSMAVKPTQGATLYINTSALSGIFQRIMESSVETTITHSLTGVQITRRPEGNTSSSNQRRNGENNPNNSVANNGENSSLPSSTVQFSSFPLPKIIVHESEISYDLNSQLPSWIGYRLNGRFSRRNNSLITTFLPFQSRRDFNLENIIGNSLNENNISDEQNLSSNTDEDQTFSEQQNSLSSSENPERQRLANILNPGVSFLDDNQSPLENPFSEENNWEENLDDYDLSALGFDPDNESVATSGDFLNDSDSVPIPEISSLMGLLLIGGGLFFGKKIERASD